MNVGYRQTKPGHRITHLSRHALQRLDERSLLDSVELTRILDCGDFVIVGHEPASNREHRLVYSFKDNSHYVVIQDVHIGKVVTVLPPDYYRNLFYSISDQDLIKAQQLAVSRSTSPETASQLHELRSSIFHIKAFFVNFAGDQKCKNILKISARPYMSDIAVLLDEGSLADKIGKALLEKNVEPDSVWLISIRLGSRGEQYFFDWRRGALI
jgi:hypothetical protein